MPFYMVSGRILPTPGHSLPLPSNVAVLTVPLWSRCSQFWNRPWIRIRCLTNRSRIRGRRIGTVILMYHWKDVGLGLQLVHLGVDHWLDFVLLVEQIEIQCLWVLLLLVRMWLWMLGTSGRCRSDRNHIVLLLPVRLAVCR